MVNTHSKIWVRRFTRAIQHNMLRTRFFLGFLSLVIILLAMAMYSMRSTRNLTDTITAITSENYQVLRDLQDAKMSGSSITQALFLAEQGHTVRARALAEREVNKLERSVTEYRTNIGTTMYPSQSRRFQEAGYRSVAYTRLFIDPETPQSIRDTLNATLSVVIQEMSHNANDLERRFIDNVSIKAERSKYTAEKTQTYVFVAVTIAILGSLYVSWMLVLWILKPIRQLAAQFHLISQGNYGLQVPMLSGDELGLLAKSFNHMSSKLKLYSDQTSEQILLLQRTIQRTFASFPHPILIMRDDNQVEYSNPAANRFLSELGYNPNDSIVDFLQQHMDTIFQAESDYLPENLNEALTFRIGSQERHYLPRILQLRDPSAPKLGMAIILDDITSMRLVDGIKTNLISTVSHEIKNPLTTMRMAIHLLIEKNVGPLNDRQTELAEMIRDESERMLDTLDGLLELARIDHRDQIINKDVCDVHDVVLSVILEHQELAALRSIVLEMDIDDRQPKIMADIRILCHILRNYTSNACKYANPGTIVIRTESMGNFLRFSVIDGGPGIDKDIHNKLFERFWRIPGESQAGTGLGLAIVKQMAESHGGKVGLDSDTGMGSTFWFDIPQK